jgi:hypothetical protein
VDARPAPCLDVELVCGGTRSSGCHQFPIGLSADEQSLIRRLYLDQSDQFHFDRIIASSSCSSSFFTDVTGVGNVFNMKRSPYDFNFCFVYASISSVDN